MELWLGLACRRRHSLSMRTGIEVPEVSNVELRHQDSMCWVDWRLMESVAAPPVTIQVVQ